MTQTEIIQTAIRQVRAQAAGMPVDIVTRYVEDCLDFHGTTSITTYRIEVAMNSVIRVANAVLAEMEKLEHERADLHAERQPNGDIRVVDGQAETVIVIPANK